MFNIGVNLDIDVKKIQYPLYFEKRNVCIHCGAENTLTFVDKFGNKTRKEIHAFDHLTCTACGRIYSIKWENDENSDKMYPVAVEPSVKQEFINLVTLNKVKDKGEKEL